MPDESISPGGTAPDSTQGLAKIAFRKAKINKLAERKQSKIFPGKGSHQDGLDEMVAVGALGENSKEGDG
jgi:hypothetical protein